MVVADLIRNSVVVHSPLVPLFGLVEYSLFSHRNITTGIDRLRCFSLSDNCSYGLTSLAQGLTILLFNDSTRSFLNMSPFLCFENTFGALMSVHVFVFVHVLFEHIHKVLSSQSSFNLIHCSSF